MALKIPSSPAKILQTLKAEVRKRLPKMKTVSWIDVVLTACSFLFFSLYRTLVEAVKESFISTATKEEYIESHAADYGITRNQATKSEGFVVFSGIIGGNIPINTELVNDEGGFYQTLSAGNITARIVNVSSMTRDDNIVTVVCSFAHELATNINITVQGASEPEYNGSFVISEVLSDNSFSFLIETTPSSPATGSILIRSLTDFLKIESVGFGESNNLISGDSLTLTQILPGIDNNAFVDFNGIQGGADLEDILDLKARTLNRTQNIYGNWSKASIEAFILSISGNTRVWIKSAGDLLLDIPIVSIDAYNDGGGYPYAIITTSSPHNLIDGDETQVSGANEVEFNRNSIIQTPDVDKIRYSLSALPSSPATGSIELKAPIARAGRVKIYFVRDNDGEGTEILPTGIELDNARNILEQYKPPNLSFSDVIVQAPVAKIINITISELSPNTISMQNAITENLKSSFKRATNLGEKITRGSIENIIRNTIDDTNTQVKELVLTQPASDVLVNYDELGILGTITYI